MIKMEIEIDLAPTGIEANEFGAGVFVRTKIDDPKSEPEAVGATYVGICMAINDYMHARGCPTFNCFKKAQ